MTWQLLYPVVNNMEQSFSYPVIRTLSSAEARWIQISLVITTSVIKHEEDFSDYMLTSRLSVWKDMGEQWVQNQGFWENKLLDSSLSWYIYSSLVDCWLTTYTVDWGKRTTLGGNNQSDNEFRAFKGKGNNLKKGFVMQNCSVRMGFTTWQSEFSFQYNMHTQTTHRANSVMPAINYLISFMFTVFHR